MKKRSFSQKIFVLGESRRGWMGMNHFYARFCLNQGIMTLFMGRLAAIFYCKHDMAQKTYVRMS